MQLKSLDIHGFKSFPDRIQLQFDPGITAVVGPNGSGKSNIADAVRWVLGEQSGKTLRSGKMEDVIFTGTQQRKPMGYANVSLAIDNRDRSLGIEADEVVISRRLYRSGESEYRLNGTAVRLKDINELLMDTGLGRDGYSIIGQGRIAEIVSAKSAQRREIFEEAAGISKYRYRKEQAQKRLEQAQENLLRLKDILGELEARVEPLRAQAQKAQEYLQYAERKRALEISLWLLSIERAKEQLREQEDKLVLARNDHDELEEALEEIEENIQAVYGEIAACNVEEEARRARAADIGQALADSTAKVAVLRNDISHNEETARRLEESIGAHQKSRGELEERLRISGEEAAGKRARHEELLARDRALREALLALEEENGAALRRQNALTQQRAELARQLSNHQLRLATSSTMLEQLRLNAAGIDESARQGESALREYEKQLDDVRALIGHIDEELTSQQNVKKGYLIKHKAAGDRLEALQQTLGELQSQQRGYLQKAKLLEDMERNMEGFLQSVKFIMGRARSGMLKGIEGPVSQLISVEGRYAAAIEVALGAAMQNIVVTTDAAAKYAIEALKSAKAGRATFLPLSVIKPRTLEEKGLPGAEGFVAVASDLVRAQAQYRGVVENLLGRIVVAEDMDSALRLAKRFSYRFKVVTLDGQVVNPGGSMTGGSLAHSAGILSRAGEITRLRDKARAAQGEIDGAAADIKAAQEALSALSAQLVAIDADVKTMGEDRIRYEGEQKRLELSMAEARRQRQESAQRAAEIREKLESLAQESGSSDEAVRKTQGLQQELERALEEAGEAVEACAGRLAEKKEALAALEIERLSLQKDMEHAQALAQGLREQLSGQQTQAQELQSQIDALAQKNGEIRAAIAQEEARAAALREESGRCAQEIAGLGEKKNALEQRATRERQRERELHQRGEELARQLARLEERKSTIQGEYDAVIARLYDEYELTLTTAQELRQPVGDVNAANRELSGLKSKIKALGSINVAAIEEYKEVSERYAFMRAQLRDVEDSKAQLHKLIGDLTGEMKALFTQSFQEINMHFGRIFVELFSGGSAKLLLTDPENVLESGIEIYVQPPGKIIKNLAALSGGEQAFVAIAIYFAILKVRPSPFCLLDEIEAALDDVNVVKYARYLRRLTGSTQFIAITHRRGTMEEADVLYGVTMQEEGVSKLLRLGVSELESKLGMKA